MRRGFTLTELMIAVAVLIGVLLAVSKIFSTTSAVTAAGEATSDILQEAAAIEQQIRADFEQLSRDGFFAIRCVGVPNDVNGAVLLNPNRPADAVIRADQLMFFTQGVASVQTYRLGQGLDHKGQGTASRVYYGHAFQLPDARGFEPVESVAYDPAPGLAIPPWRDDEVEMVKTRFAAMAVDTDTDIFEQTEGYTYKIPPIDNRRWLFVRQPVLLVDDDMFARDTNAKTRYLGQVQSARSVFLVDPAIGFTPQVRDGRVDAAAMGMDDVRRLIQYAVPPGPAPLSWRGGALGHVMDQYSHIAKQMMFYPRAERTAPSMSRVDQALTNHVLLSACSEVRIDWTYGNGVGAVGDIYAGVRMNPAELQEWFGPNNTYAEFAADGFGADTIFPAAVEGPGSALLGADVYDAFFGFNQDEPLDGNGEPALSVGYTPWPTAIRITLTLHDRRTTLEGGREVQFVIHLPKRGVTS